MAPSAEGTAAASTQAAPAAPFGPSGPSGPSAGSVQPDDSVQPFQPVEPVASTEPEAQRTALAGLIARALESANQLAVTTRRRKSSKVTSTESDGTTPNSE